MEYLTLTEAAAQLGLSVNTVKVQATRGALTTTRIGRMRVTTSAWLAEYRARTAAETRGGKHPPKEQP